MTDFDAEVRDIRKAGVAAVHKPCGKNKRDCTPTEWAMHLEWRAAYYRTHRNEWDFYRNRWIAKRSRAVGGSKEQCDAS